jgi:hypothetical protein
MTSQFLEEYHRPEDATWLSHHADKNRQTETKTKSIIYCAQCKNHAVRVCLVAWVNPDCLSLLIHGDPNLVGLRFCHVFGSLYLLRCVEFECCLLRCVWLDMMSWDVSIESSKPKIKIANKSNFFSQRTLNREWKAIQS